MTDTPTSPDTGASRVAMVQKAPSHPPNSNWPWRHTERVGLAGPGGRLRLLLGLLGLFIGIALAAAAAYPVFAKWRREQPLREAEAFLKRGDLQRAEASARRALKLNPDSLAAMRFMAEASEHGDFSDAIAWRRAVTERAPSSADDRIALANDYLRSGDMSAADRILDGVQGDARNSTGFHGAAAVLAARLNRRDEAENHFAELVKRSPDDRHYRVNLALLRIDSSSPGVSGPARKELEQLSEDPELQLPVLRALISDARRAGAKPQVVVLRLSPVPVQPSSRTRGLEIDDPADSHRLLGLMQSLDENPNAELQDRILVLEFLQETQDFGFDSYLKRLQNGTVALSHGIGDLMLWMNSHGLAKEAMDWAASLPKKDSELPEVRFAVADSLILLQNWKELKSRIVKADWQGSELVRLAIESGVCRHEGTADKALLKLTASVAGARYELSTFIDLARFCERWHWESEAAEILWAIARGGGAGQIQALENLRRLYTAANDGNGLWDVSKRLLQLNPGDAAAKNSVAFFSLLHLDDSMKSALHRGYKLHPLGRFDGWADLNFSNICKMAEESYRTRHADPGCATTYAYSLYLQNRFAEGLRALDTLTPEQRESPSLAGYYGLLLAASGRREEAVRFFTIAAGNPHLLREEQAIFAEAQANEPLSH